MIPGIINTSLHLTANIGTGFQVTEFIPMTEMSFMMKNHYPSVSWTDPLHPQTL